MSDHHKGIADDAFLIGYDPTELRIASEFLSNWLPYLSRDLCRRCTQSLSDRVRSLDPSSHVAVPSKREEDMAVFTPRSKDLNFNRSCQDLNETNSVGSWKDGAEMNDAGDTNSLASWKDEANGCSEPIAEASSRERVPLPTPVKSPPRVRVSWADMAQEDELEAEEEIELSTQLINGDGQLREALEEDNAEVMAKPTLSREQREFIRFTNVKRKKDYICFERINGKLVNILDGLELHTGIFSAVEQKRIVDFIYKLQEMGKNGDLKDRTYTAPQKWMRGKGRVTIQFGCCYNYAVDKYGNPPGILQDEMVDPIPHLFKVIIRRLVKWQVLPPTCIPDSCIVNIYDEGDCIPPHIDNHDFVRPFCTVSFLSECKIVFGSNLKIEGPGEFSGAYAIPLPVGSVLVLNGNGADVAKHCVPAVPTKRISITFRKMDETKRPFGFVPEPDLQGLEPLLFKSDLSSIANRVSDRKNVQKQFIADKSKGLVGSRPRFMGRSRRGPRVPTYDRRRGRVVLDN